jgi:hypothetical protein
MKITIFPNSEEHISDVMLQLLSHSCAGRNLRSRIKCGMTSYPQSPDYFMDNAIYVFSVILPTLIIRVRRGEF